MSWLAQWLNAPKVEPCVRVNGYAHGLHAPRTPIDRILYRATYQQMLQESEARDQFGVRAAPVPLYISRERAQQILHVDASYMNQSTQLRSTMGLRAPRVNETWYAETNNPEKRT